MSGDSQPRRRKDKKRRRDDEGTPPPTLINAAEAVPENITIHVHKEGGTGGHWCARIIFFSLMAVLLGLVVLIIVEHRGETDVEIPIASSPWALLFEGWVDDTSPIHDDDSHAEEEADDEHDHDDNDEHDEEEDEHDEGEDEEDEQEGDEDEGDESTDDTLDEDEAESKQETDEGLGSDEGVSEQDVYQYGQDEQGTEEDEEDEGYTQETFEDDMNTLEEVENASGEDEIYHEEINDGSHDDDDDQSRVNDGVDRTTEDDVIGEFLNIPNAKDIDDNSDEPLEEVDGDDPEEIVNDIMSDEDTEEVVEEEEETTSVAVKFGVGLALIVAAHFVLVRRWKNAERDIPENVDLSRRNTIVPPENLSKVTKISSESMPNKEQEETYKALGSKYKNLDTKTAMEELFAKKMADITILERESNVTSGVQDKDDRQYDDEDEDEEYIEDEEEDEEGEDDEEEEEEEEDEEEGLEEIDDTELVAKLDAKYGKLPTPPDSEEEEEEEEYEVEDEDEGEDEELSGWKHVRGPLPASQSKTQSGTSEKVTTKSSGAQSLEFVNESSDIIEIHEEIDSFTSREIDT